MKTYNTIAAAHGVNGFGSFLGDTQVSSTLGAGVEATFTVPSTTSMGGMAMDSNYMAVFSYEPAKKVWVAVNATAAVPAGNTLVATASILNPSAKIVKAGDIIHVISAAAADVGIEFYQI